MFLIYMLIEPTTDITKAPSTQLPDKGLWELSTVSHNSLHRRPWHRDCGRWVDVSSECHYRALIISGGVQTKEKSYIYCELRYFAQSPDATIFSSVSHLPLVSDSLLSIRSLTIWTRVLNSAFTGEWQSRSIENNMGFFFIDSTCSDKNYIY